MIRLAAEGGEAKDNFISPAVSKSGGSGIYPLLLPLVRLSAFVAVILYRTSGALLFILPKLPTLENPSWPEHHFVMFSPFNLPSPRLLLPTLQDRGLQATLSRPLEKTQDNAKPSFFVLDAEFLLPLLFFAWACDRRFLRVSESTGT
jgi:hypothetical protein